MNVVAGSTYDDSIAPIFGRNVAQHVVIIDDQATGLIIMEAVIRKISPNISCSAFSDPLEALDACAKDKPDLLITDYKMPGMDGIEVIGKFRKISGCEDVPIVMVTVITDKKIRYQALEAGATDFLMRPVDSYECQARCANLLLLHQHQKASQCRASVLQEKVVQATKKIRERERETLLCLAKAGEFRDEGTGNHVLRMAKYSRIIAEGMGMSTAECDQLELAAPMHDIGKIGIADEILLKHSSLSDGEKKIMQTHTTIGHAILEKSRSPYLKLAAKIALTHHEHFDGNGYPHGLKGSDIPIEARIVAVSDTLDALTSVRPYKKSWSFYDSVKYISNLSGKQFDPDCVSAMLGKITMLQKIYTELSDAKKG